MATPNLFNLRYDGGIFIGLYDGDKLKVQEPYPEGTPVLYCTTAQGKKVKMRGTVISVPLPSALNTLPADSISESPYQIRWVDGSTFSIPPVMMDDIVDFRSSSSQRIFSPPAWLRASEKVMLLKDGEYVKGCMEYDVDADCWQFAQCQRNGDELWSIALPNFLTSFQNYIDDGLLIPGHHTNAGFICGSALHVSAMGLSLTHPPGSLKKALDRTSPNHRIWFDSYKEEYDALFNNSTFETISEEEYHRHCKLSGRSAIPSMAVFTIKKDKLGRPLRARIASWLWAIKIPSSGRKLIVMLRWRFFPLFTFSLLWP